MIQRSNSEADRVRIWFRTISDHVYDTSGIRIHAENRGIYERRVNELMTRHQLPHLRDYSMRIRYHPRAREYTQELIESITTGETYFYREAKQLESFLRRLLRPLKERASAAGEPVRVFSVGCSSGEEPYTLAMMMLEAGYNAHEVEIVAGDISQRALHASRQGIYRESAFRVMPPAWRARYFSRTDDGRFRINDRVRELVEFVAINLMNGDAMASLPRAHAVFCRNVLIYFDRAAKTRAIEHLHRLLVPGGVLLPGHAESLLNLEHPFLMEQIDGELIYRKALP